MLVQVPEVEGNEVLRGQVLAVEVAGLTDSLGTFKARLAEVRTRLHAVLADEQSRLAAVCSVLVVSWPVLALPLVSLPQICVLQSPQVCASLRTVFFVCGRC